jgi:hypothetical protein
MENEIVPPDVIVTPKDYVKIIDLIADKHTVKDAMRQVGAPYGDRGAELEKEAQDTLEALKGSGLASGLASDINSDINRPLVRSPRNPLETRLQALIAQNCLAWKKIKPIPPPKGVRFVTPVSFGPEFSTFDFIGWIQMSPDLIFKPPKHGWVPPPAEPIEMGDKFTMAVISDSSTDRYGVRPIKQCIERLKPQVVVHLGDTYYSGTFPEIRDRLVLPFPECGGQTSMFALNGNHEMYSGGRDYFSALISFFGRGEMRQKSSCFALQNDHWLLVFLDTAFGSFDHLLIPGVDSPGTHGDLMLGAKEKHPDAQLKWLKDITKPAQLGGRKVILFSHHPLFSLRPPSYNLKMKKQVEQWLGGGPKQIHAWFWGHEHRLAVHDQGPGKGGWNLKARCVGYSGTPEQRDLDDWPNHPEIRSVRLNGKAVKVEGEEFAIPAANALDGPNPLVEWFGSDYSPHGYVILEFDGDQCYETYKVMNQDGTPPGDYVPRDLVEPHQPL